MEIVIFSIKRNDMKVEGQRYNVLVCYEKALFMNGEVIVRGSVRKDVKIALRFLYYSDVDEMLFRCHCYCSDYGIY
ncbi:hypothetical protein [Kineothrix sp. MB12-C1]|uniref:hypothetical protein n=1 Tax=Kineothrix sp. MB12-C1 TaxID=3070215 RepID=UPI0027D2595A|nr:hypothetical protein [Kineothrix sp. MB12-C1]WMC91971.1 hypothetical protein RBB56_14025 [Kineothrix sp. MB12-C1]